MRYMMLIYSHEEEAATPEDMGAVAMAHKALMDETRRRGIFRAACLQPGPQGTLNSLSRATRSCGSDTFLMRYSNSPSRSGRSLVTSNTPSDALT